MSTGQKGELIQVLIATSQIYAPFYDDHKTWDYTKIYSEIIGYMFSIIVEKSVTGYCWKLSYEEWTLLTWFKSILWDVLEYLFRNQRQHLSANEPQTETIHLSLLAKKASNRRICTNLISFLKLPIERGT